MYITLLLRRLTLEKSTCWATGWSKTPFMIIAPPLQVTPYLYLGNDRHAAYREQLVTRNIRYLINCGVECKHYLASESQSYQVLALPLLDDEKEDISEYFEHVQAFIGPLT